MNSIRQILRSPSFLFGTAGIFLTQLLILLFTTPLYDIDTNSFIRGGLSWDIYHNPFENIYVAVAGKIWSNATFLAGGQILFFALAASLFSHVIFSKKSWLIAALLICSLEPVTMFYNFSILPESFYTSFTLLYCTLLILWMREPAYDRGFFFGLFMGFAFLCKLSAMVQTALFLFILIKRQFSFFARLRHLAWSVLPFAACYLFVLVGQKSINSGELYTVAGRVRWDFSSSQYNPDEISGDDFKRFVNPHIFREGKLVEHRELRRELSYLGYKNCISEYEVKGFREGKAINCCDSIFGAVGSQIMAKHFWAAEAQFIKDNLWCIHHLNYLDYRFTPGLHFYYEESEFRYIDSLMETHFGVNLAKNENRIPGQWKSMSWLNVYTPLWWWLMWFCILASVILLITKREFNQNIQSLQLISTAIAIPLLFHLVYISFRLRFLSPFFLPGILLVMLTAEYLLSVNKKTPGENNA